MRVMNKPRHIMLCFYLLYLMLVNSAQYYNYTAIMPQFIYILIIFNDYTH